MSILKKVASKMPGSNNKKHYLALLVTYQGVEAVIWHIKDNRLAIVSQSAATFGENAKILETAADAIDKACEQAQEDVIDVILGLPDSWISQNQILPQYFDKLKELADNLDLEPFAFVAQNHAVANRIKLHYGTLVSGLLLHVDQENFTLSSIQGGHITQTRFIQSAPVDYVAGLQKLFAHFTNSPVLGETVFLYASGHLPAGIENTIRDLSIFGTNKPKITILERSYASQSIALAGAVDRGNALGIHVEDLKDMPQNVVMSPKAAVMSALATEQAATEVPVVGQAAALNDTSPERTQWEKYQASDNLQPVPHTAAVTAAVGAQQTNVMPEGFVAGSDISETSLNHPKDFSSDVQMHQATETSPVDSIPLHAVPEVAKPAPAMPQPMTPSVSHQAISMQPAATPHPFDQVVQNGQFASELPESVNERPPKRSLSLPAFSAILHKLKSVKPKLVTPKFTLPHAPVRFLKSRGIFVIVPIILVVLAMILFVTVPKAEVLVSLQTQPIDGTVGVVASTTATAVNTTAKQVPAQTVTTDVSGDLKGTATGKKKVGEKAKGSITIYNKTASSKSFPANQPLTGANVTFVLNSAVTVPARTSTESADREIVIKPGKATIAVTASDIGEEANVPSGTNFVLRGFSSDLYDAQAEGVFSGGTSRDVTIISDVDIKRAEDALTKQLIEQAKTDILTKVGTDKKVLEGSTGATITKKSAAKKVGDEARDFTLNATARAQITVYSQQDVDELIKSIIAGQIPTGFTLAEIDENLAPQVKKTEKNGDVTFDVNYSAKLLPEVNTQAIKQQLAGKDIKTGADIAKAMPYVSNVTVTILPEPFAILQRIPFSDAKINVTTQAAQ